MISMILTGDSASKGPARVDAAEVVEPDSGFANLMQEDLATQSKVAEPTDELPLEIDQTLLPAAMSCLSLPQVRLIESDLVSDETALSIRCLEAGCDDAVAGSVDEILPDLPPPPATQTPAPPGTNAVSIVAQIVVGSDDAMRSRPPGVTQGCAETALRAALQPEATPSDDLLLADDPPDPEAEPPLAGPASAAADPAPQSLRSDPPLRLSAATHMQPAVVVAQILPKVRGHDGEVELLLAPEELGKLRFHIQHDGTLIRISLAAERPETMDLLRRHAVQLLQEFHQSGYSEATIDFGQWKQNGQQGQGARAITLANSEPIDGLPADLARLVSTAPPYAPQGLNLRL